MPSVNLESSNKYSTDIEYVRKHQNPYNKFLSYLLILLPLCIFQPNWIKVESFSLGNKEVYWLKKEFYDIDSQLLGIGNENIQLDTLYEKSGNKNTIVTINRASFDFFNRENNIYKSLCTSDWNKKTVQPDNKIKEMNILSRNLSKMVLESASAETKNLLKVGFQGLGSLIDRYHLTAKDLDFLIQSVPDARAEFSIKYTQGRQERLLKLQKFIHQMKNTENIKNFDKDFPVHVSNFETILTAIGYRVIGPPWIQPTVQASNNIQNFLKDFKNSKYIVPGIGKEEFPLRGLEARPTYDQPFLHIPSNVQEPLTKTSHFPRPGLSASNFQLNSYIGNALAENIPMRASVSASASLSLATLRFILRKGDEKIKLNEHDLMRFSGMLCATYDLGDYHSPTETSAGIVHFYQKTMKIEFRNKAIKKLQDMTPKNFLALSIGFLGSTVDDSKMGEFDSMSNKLLECVKKS